MNKEVLRFTVVSVYNRIKELHSTLIIGDSQIAILENTLNELIKIHGYKTISIVSDNPMDKAINLDTFIDKQIEDIIERSSIYPYNTVINLMNLIQNYINDSRGGVVDVDSIEYRFDTTTA
ncbi:MAG: hypothetical protein ACRC92_27135 [Peptostreptococcaceae bacterium]